MNTGLLFDKNSPNHHIQNHLNPNFPVLSTSAAGVLCDFSDFHLTPCHVMKSTSCKEMMTGGLKVHNQTIGIITPAVLVLIMGRLHRLHTSSEGRKEQKVSQCRVRERNSDSVI